MESSTITSDSQDPVMGVHFCYRNPVTKSTDFLCANLKDVKIIIDPVMEKARSGFDIPMQVLIDGKRYPFRLQSPPLVLKKFVQGKSKRRNYAYSLMSFDYKSIHNPTAARNWKMQMAMVDSAVLAFLIKHAVTIWPNDKLTKEEIEERYVGLAKEKIYRKTAQPEPQHDAEKGLKEVIIENQEIKQVEAKVDDSEPQEKKRKIEPYEPSADRVLATDDVVRSFPADFTVFPLRKGEKYECRATGPDGQPRKVNEMKQGMEIASTVEVRLSVEDGVAKLSLTGINFEIALLDISAVCRPAKLMFTV